MKLSSREKNLALIVGLVLAVLLNLFLVSAFSRRNTALRSELVERKVELSGINALLEVRDQWSAKDAALTARQPKLSNENAAGVELLDLVRLLAKKHSVTLENEVFGGVVASQWSRSVPVTLDTHSSWPDLISFLYSIQKPDQFIVCEAANIQVDPSDQTKMLGHLKIARWYAP